MYKYKLTISYDGTNYCGWQIQPNGTSIQELVQKALSTLYKSPINVTGCGRTDSGVHAMNHTLHFIAPRPVPLHYLNGILPKDVRANRLELADSSFHARISAKQKRYHYYITTSPSAFLHPFSLYEPKLDIEALRLASKKFIGTKDFTSFANSSKDRIHRSKVRTIFQIDVNQIGSLVEVVFIGNGFLYKQIRNMIGCMLFVSRKKMTLDQIDVLFEAKDRKKAPPGAKARGLFLIDVVYDTNFELIEENDTKCEAPFFMASSTPK